MADFRYAQFCPLARATEVLGERWTLLIVRELLLGPKRFSDLQRPLVGVSSSVLSDRLGRLEARGIVARRELPPPAAAVIYELTETGRALLPVVVELARWGARFLGAPEPGEHLEPEWIRLGCVAFARREASPARAYRVAVRTGESPVVFFVRGGPEGTSASDAPCETDASIEGEPLAILALVAGGAEPRSFVEAGTLSFEGDPRAVADFPSLFDLRVSAP